MTDEILEPETSNEDIVDTMMDNYRPLETDGGSTLSGCAGNIATECVRQSLNEVSRALQGREDYVLVGGIPTQVEYVRRRGHESPQVMDNFGRRKTNDLDILAINPREIKGQIRESGYEESNRLTIDAIGPGLFENSEDIIDSGELHSYEAYGSADVPLDAELRVPQDTDLLYTKAHDRVSRESMGTSSDAQVIATSGVFDIEDGRMDYLTAGNAEAQTYLEELGY